MRGLARSTGTLLIASLASFGAGCASHWTPRATTSVEPLQWPLHPAAAKVRFVRSLAGFSPAAGAGAAWRTFVRGRDPARGNDFLLPVAVAVGAGGRMAVADLGRAAVHLYLPAQRRYLRLTGSAERPMVSPVGVAFDSKGGLFVSDSSGALYAFGADGRFRFRLESAHGERLRRPTGLAYSPARDRFYVVDTLACRVHAFASDGRHEISFGARGAGEGELNFPTHLFRAPSGRIFVSDSLNFRVAIFDEDGAPLGSFGHHGDGSGDLAMPKGIAVDRDGIVYVADSLFDNVQLFDEKGTFLLTLGRRGNGAGEFWLPAGLFIDADEELYVCDTYNHRVQIFRLTPGYAPIVA